MKLLYCWHCGDVLKLQYKPRVCKCGRSEGFYHPNGLDATIKGDKVMAVGFENASFERALMKQPDIGTGERFEAFVIPKKVPTIKVEK